jgi:hypothetical protein
MLLPLAVRWAEEQEAVILREGVPLTENLLKDARQIGVSQPEKVRLRVVETVPLPEDPALQAAAEMTGLLSPLTAGLTLRYGIFIRADCWGLRSLVAHELVHTMQYERLGGFSPFLERYLQECLTLGYPHGELEREARRIELDYP